jgi:CxxC motif-containing protein (DUF1111 family)
MMTFNIDCSHGDAYGADAPGALEVDHGGRCAQGARCLRPARERVTSVVMASGGLRYALLLFVLLAHCSAAPGLEVPLPTDDGVDPLDVALVRATDGERALFFRGKALFQSSFLESDGLGPLFIDAACHRCHATAVDKPVSVEKMAAMDADGGPSDDQTALPFGHTARRGLAAGAMTPIAAPSDPSILTTTRVGPSLFGRGYVEAIADSEIERIAAQQRTRVDSIGGRVNHVVYMSEANPDPRFGAHAKGEVLIGRFGLKARIATLDDFTGDALQGDMGVTSPLRPVELPNPDGLTDDGKPGVDVDSDFLNGISNYVRLVEIPPRRGLTDRGRQLFERVQCNVCHVPSLRTRADYPILELSAIDAPIYSDLLLHDMGIALADGITDGNANWREWKTAPLVGLRFARTYLHDGRARSVEEAISMHGSSGSEAGGSIRLFQALSERDRRELLSFVGAL